MLYPYHLSDVFYKGLQLTPFAYYREMMLAIMQRDDRCALEGEGGVLKRR